jgi:hypothetical protein
MGRRSITCGVMPAGSDGIQFDLHINGRRLRPTLPSTPTEENLQRARDSPVIVFRAIESPSFLNQVAALARALRGF